MPPLEGAVLEVSGQLISIVKHRILGLNKMVSCAKNGGPILMIFMLYDIFVQGLLGDSNECICSKVLSGVKFF